MRNIRPVIVVLLCIINKGRTICSTEYGGEPCRFIPALPGKTPPCARPGITYCEYPEYYPTNLIHYLADKWMFNHQTLLSDESVEEFSSYSVPSYSYTPNNIYEHYNPENFYAPKKDYIDQHYSKLNTYLPPTTNAQRNSSEFQGYTDAKPDKPFYQEPPSKIKYDFNVLQPYNSQPQQSQLITFSAITPPQITYYSPKEWWKRHAREPNINQSFITKRRKRSFSRKSIPVNSLSNSTVINRKKRQATSRGESLCQSRSQYIMPRAALNNRGNWMFIVNMPNDRYTQLVKSEICVSQQCNGLCSLPNGYTSRCEQKYIQKRLVALEGTGNQLYTDIFWFPSCCICTIFNS